ncbi:hypothetical protein GCM10009840_29200 [Pseudolysinimonas kribbensis]|uniref:Uncharacterized protein n=1 Tax=Pseudolysinimonas kribbensis TaxID=433641 RepID=A0ABQ6K8E2_9MICO|nr:hypothetical protein [Pseudolysinimonas kribbensis]GMA96247.1 hypothetical protein GCM10025881_30710 [Pseudolysinimonas kribbensis]
MTLLERPRGTLSAQQVDPLSWVSGPFVPLVLGLLVLAYGSVMGAITLPDVRHPGAQFVAAGICAAACLFVHLATRPMRPQIGWAAGVIAMLIAASGLVLSALGYVGARFTIETWWAPIGVAMVIASLAPYLSVRRILALGLGATIVGTPFAYLAIAPQVPLWGPVSIALMIAGPQLLGVAGAATFSAVVVHRMVPMLERRSQLLVSLDAARSEDVERAERRRLAELSARVVPFLEGVAETGEVTLRDRGLAGQLARQLRDDLVARSNLSWLDSVAETEPIVVVDPERRANRMRPAQRTALRGLLRAILETPGADAGSVLVELRGQPDGATAVAVSLDVDLPEGRRIMHLSPYYLTLDTAVRGLRWDDVRHLRFEVPPE